MTTTVDAIYEHGKLLLPEPLSLPEKSRVRVTIESDPEREAWLKLSEESLMKTWSNDADDVFNVRTPSGHGRQRQIPVPGPD